jgi:hypothetical protein
MSKLSTTSTPPVTPYVIYDIDIKKAESQRDRTHQSARREPETARRLFSKLGLAVIGLR